MLWALCVLFCRCLAGLYSPGIQLTVRFNCRLKLIARVQKCDFNCWAAASVESGVEDRESESSRESFTVPFFFPPDAPDEAVGVNTCVYKDSFFFLTKM